MSIPSMGGFAAEDAAEQDPTVKIGFKINTKDDLTDIKPVLLSSILDDFVYPEIMNRVKLGVLDPSFKPYMVHMLTYSDSRRNDILLNDNVRFIGLVQLNKKKRTLG